jgi:hypothetical protein
MGVPLSNQANRSATNLACASACTGTAKCHGDAVVCSVLQPTSPCGLFVTCTAGLADPGLRFVLSIREGPDAALRCLCFFVGLPLARSGTDSAITVPSQVLHLPVAGARCACRRRQRRFGEPDACI